MFKVVDSEIIILLTIMKKSYLVFKRVVMNIKIGLLNIGMGP